MSKEAIKELIDALENIKESDYELFMILKNNAVHISDLAHK